jgi:hypothetical protein
MKHNKKRNTAFIYEALIREFTKAIVEKDTPKKKIALNLLKEHFAKGSLLFQELELYKVLLETSHIQENIAQRLLHETLTRHSTLNENAIFDAQSQIIASINKHLGQEVWSNFIPNFKSIASINAIFSSKGTVKKKVLFEQDIIDRMSAPRRAKHTEGLKSLDSLTYNSFIKKFNQKYGDLLEEQKNLLNQYITSFADDGLNLRIFLNEELSRLKGLFTSARGAPQEEAVTQKVNELLEYLEEFRKREFKDADLNKILKTQALAREMLLND